MHSKIGPSRMAEQKMKTSELWLEANLKRSTPPEGSTIDRPASLPEDKKWLVPPASVSQIGISCTNGWPEYLCPVFSKNAFFLSLFHFSSESVLPVTILVILQVDYS